MNTKQLIIALLSFVAIALGACDPTTTNLIPDEITDILGTGILYDEEIASLPSIPKDLSIVTLEDIATPTNSSRVVLDDYVPPVRSQGAYGTCTAWGVGYNTRTIMYAREHNLTPADLQDDANVFSPKDLFLAMRQASGGTDCNGSVPANAFKIMQNRGIATLASAPYTDLGYCTQGTDPGNNDEAAKYKIENYRRADHTDISALKSYLAMGRPVQISCKLGKTFQTWNYDVEVLYSDDYTTNDGTHARHAMCLVGYDDDKGTNGAFRIVNSWGTDWGDKGFAWIDYDFFISEFCYSAYVIEGDKGGLTDGMVNEEIINPNFQVAGKDFITVRFTDELLSGRNRRLTYNVFNKGNETIHASEDWNIIYYYYNAFDPENDFGIIVYDYYSDDIGVMGANGDFADVSTTSREYGIFNWWNHVDVKPGYSVARAVAGETGYDYDFEFDYEMPNITGEYYLVLMADGFNSLEEQYEQNNFIFLTGADKAPLHIENGVVQGMATKSTKENTVHCGTLKQSQPNAYQIDEIANLIHHQQRTGKLQTKAMLLKSYKQQNTTKRTIRAVLPREM